jgi:hypothetical protein
MKLEEVKQIKITMDETQINEHLAKGYHILKIISSKRTEGERDLILPCFILGL